MSDQQLTGRYDVQALLDRNGTTVRTSSAVAPRALRRRRIRARARRLTGAGTVLSAIAVAVAGAVLFGTDGDQSNTALSAPQARAGRTAPKAAPPTRPISKTTPRRPSRGQATPRPTTTAAKSRLPVAPVTPARPTAAATSRASQLHHLADLLGNDARAVALDELRSAAANLDQAATQLSTGNTAAAEALIQRAFERVADTQRSGNWQPSRTESDLLGSFGYRPPPVLSADHHHDD
ncbi:hypothetical protein EV651_12362 [Kribbella sp. VKM Ac-2571]|nr:hypothetical protein EV651_12362 [Kribbella sp. VKM Ac-2571]